VRGRECVIGRVGMCDREGGRVGVCETGWRMWSVHKEYGVGVCRRESGSVHEEEWVCMGVECA